MRLFPYRNLELDTPLSPDEAAARIAQVTGPVKWFRGSWSKGPDSPLFEGQVEEHSFEIQRVIYYRNSFLPKIRGAIQPSSGGSSVAIKMRMHPAPLVFMTFWLGAVGLAAGGVTLAAVADLLSKVLPLPAPNLAGVLARDVDGAGGRPNDALWACLTLIGMFLFGVLLTFGSFAYEAKKAEDELLRVLEGRLRFTP